jgi:hypothetical protein
MDAEQWLVEAVNDIGIDINGFNHALPQESINHAVKSHSSPEIEKNNGQKVLKPEDFEKVNAIIKNPDYTMVGVKKGDQDIIAYAKTFDDGTFIYIEEIVNSKKQPKSLVAKTLYNRNKRVDSVKFRNIIGNRTDVSNGKIIVGAGGNPSLKVETTPTATNSALPRNLDSLSPDSAEKSSLRVVAPARQFPAV